MSMWNLDDAVALCRVFETALKRIGFHVALGGSVLYRGESDKDLDVFVYPHATGEMEPEWDKVETTLAVLGCSLRRNCNHRYDSKTVKEFEYGGKRIDFFFVQ